MEPLETKFLIRKINGEAVISSRQIAEIYGRHHSNVMHSIEKLINALYQGRNTRFPNPSEHFISSLYVEKGHTKQAYYFLNRDAFVLLATRFQTEDALYITRSCLRALDEVNAGHAPAKTIECKRKPNIQRGIASSNEIAKRYGWNGVRLNRQLKHFGVLQEKHDTWFLTDPYEGKGYAEMITTSAGFVHLKWTKRGGKLIYDILKEHGIQPLKETRHASHV